MSDLTAVTDRASGPEQAGPIGERTFEIESPDAAAEAYCFTLG